MCNPVSGDIFFRRDDRVLSGVRVRRGMRAGGHVLDLPGRLPCSCAGCRDAHRASEVNAASNPSSFRGKRLIPGGMDASKELNHRFRVKEKKFAHVGRKDDRQVAVGMPRGSFSLTRGELRSRMCSALTLRTSSMSAQTLGSYGAPSNSFQTRSNHGSVCAAPVTEADSLPGLRSSHPQVFRRQLQKMQLSDRFQPA